MSSSLRCLRALGASAVKEELVRGHGASKALPKKEVITIDCVGSQARRPAGPSLTRVIYNSPDRRTVQHRFAVDPHGEPLVEAHRYLMVAITDVLD